MCGVCASTAGFDGVTPGVDGPLTAGMGFLHALHRAEHAKIARELAEIGKDCGIERDGVGSENVVVGWRAAGFVVEGIDVAGRAKEVDKDAGAGRAAGALAAGVRRRFFARAEIGSRERTPSAPNPRAGRGG